jgi:hypothetical protein
MRQSSNTIVVAEVFKLWYHHSWTRLHFPVSGISISRTLIFIPARIPQDSFGFLFFPEEFFHRNLLLAGARKFRFLAMFTGIYAIPANFCI